MWHYFPRGPLENRVLKTRFIIQKNSPKSQARPHLTGSDQIRERVRLEKGRLDKRERNSQIREGEKEIAWVAHLGRANPGRLLLRFFCWLLLRFFFFFLLLALFSWPVLIRYILG